MEIILKDNLNKMYVSDNIFSVKFNANLVHQVTISYLSNIRQNTKLNKNRSKVKGSNKKLWKQKGTGKSRSGSAKSPIRRSGGVTFGNQIKSYTHKINKKMYKIACRCILSKLLLQNRLLIFNNFNIDVIKTKNLYKKVYEHCKKNKTLILIDKYDDFLIKSSRNIYFIKTEILSNINIINFINFNYIITTINTIRLIEKLL